MIKTSKELHLELTLADLQNEDNGPLHYEIEDLKDKLEKTNTRYPASFLVAEIEDLLEYQRRERSMELMDSDF